MRSDGEGWARTVDEQWAKPRCWTVVRSTYFTSRVNFFRARVRWYWQLSILGPMTADSWVRNSLGVEVAEMIALSASNCSETVASSSPKTVSILSPTMSHWKSSSARSFQTILAFQSTLSRFAVLWWPLLRHHALYCAAGRGLASKIQEGWGLNSYSSATVKLSIPSVLFLRGSSEIRNHTPLSTAWLPCTPLFPRSGVGCLAGYLAHVSLLIHCMQLHSYL